MNRETDADIDLDLAVGTDALGRSDPDLEVAVVGAGALGATAAYDLATRGATVTLYDRGAVASGSSGRAAGICYDAFADGRDAEIGRDSIERFRALSGDDTFPFVECPYVWLARAGDDERADAITAQVARMQDHGIVAVEMDGDALGDRFPELRTDDVEVAGVAGGAGYTDPAAYTACLASAATGAGAKLETHTSVVIRTDPPRVVASDPAGDEASTAGETTEHEVDAVVVTAGAHTNRVLETAGLSAATKPYRVQALIASAAVSEPMCYDATAGNYVRPHPGGVLAGDGTEPVEADPDEWDRDANAGFATELVARVAHRFPAAGVVDEADVDRDWAGLCTATPDRDPLVGELAEGVYVATGFHGHGFMRAPAIGQRLAQLVLGAAPNEVGLETFDPTRFTGDESFEIVEGMARE